MTVFGGADADEATAQTAKEQAGVDEEAANKTKADTLLEAKLAEQKRLKDAGLA